MRYILKVSFNVDAGNAALRDPKFGEKMKQFLTDVKAEAAYFTAVNGQRGCYIVLQMSDASQIPSIAEPLFLWLKADIEFIPVMTPEDLMKGAPGIESAVKKWG
jgi:hypothetical protein